MSPLVSGIIGWVIATAITVILSITVLQGLDPTAGFFVGFSFGFAGFAIGHALGERNN